MTAPACLSGAFVPEFEEEENEEDTMSIVSPRKAVNLFDPAVIRSSNEETLFRAWQKSETQRVEAESKIAELQFQVQDLFARLKALEGKTVEKPVQYETDEEELAREIDWIYNKKKVEIAAENNEAPFTQVTKKRKRERNSVTPITSSPANEKAKIGKVTNITNTRKAKTPPVYILYEEQKDLLQIIDALNHQDINGVIISNNTIKASPNDSLKQMELIRTLNNLGFQYHTYENKQLRTIRVMARGIHHLTPVDHIQKYINEKYKLDCVKVAPKLQYKTKKPLNMFMLTFANGSSIDDIFNIKEICRQIITIEAIKGTKEIAQCKKCQQFGHTKTYCARIPKCARCAETHLTKDCNKDGRSAPICVNCKGNHPASYRGCPNAKEAQKARNRNNKASKPMVPKQVTKAETKKEKVQRLQKEIAPILNKINKPAPEKSLTYAQVTKKQDTKSSSVNVNLQDFMTRVLARMDQMEEQINKLGRDPSTYKGGRPKGSLNKKKSSTKSK